MLRQRYEDTADLSADEDPAALARFVITFRHGLAVMACGGTTREELTDSAQRMLAALDRAHRAARPWLPEPRTSGTSAPPGAQPRSQPAAQPEGRHREPKRQHHPKDFSTSGALLDLPRPQDN